MLDALKSGMGVVELESSSIPPEPVPRLLLMVIVGCFVYREMLYLVRRRRCRLGEGLLPAADFHCRKVEKKGDLWC